MSWKNPRTASPESSIWRDVSEDTFRQHLVKLQECTNAVPTDMRSFPIKDWLHKSAGDSHSLPLDVEQQLADDFAFLSAVEEGAQSVSAACVEEHIQPSRLIIRFAALDISLNDTTKLVLQAISELVSRCVQETHTNKSFYIELIFRRVIQLHFSRLLARLRSSKWQKPRYLSKSHKKPLWQDFANILHRIQFIYTKKETSEKRALEPRVKALASVYEKFEYLVTDTEEEIAYMKLLVRESFEFCTNEAVRGYAQRLQSSISGKPTKQVGAAVKTLRQIEKVAAYWRISCSLIDIARRYSHAFQHGMELDYLAPFTSIPTSIGYESWAKTCHVHAEVQLAAHYDGLSQERRASFHLPRAIGTSKYLCYLCYQFLRAHKKFFPSNTHGRLYDQWTIPDLAEFDEITCKRYRAIVEDMNNEVVNEITATSGPESGRSDLIRWRAEPMTSRQNLLNMDETISLNELE